MNRDVLIDDMVIDQTAADVKIDRQGVFADAD